MSEQEKIEKLERENLVLRDLVHDMFRLFHNKKDVINEILRGRAQGVVLVPEEHKE